MISIIAHRGYSARFRENSPTAWREAAAAGADVVETDIRFTADGIAAPPWRLSESRKGTLQILQILPFLKNPTTARTTTLSKGDNL